MQKIYQNIKYILSNLLSSDEDILTYELEMRFGKSEYKFNPNIGKSLFDEIFQIVFDHDKFKITQNAFIHDKIFESGIQRCIKPVEDLKFETKNFIIHPNDNLVITKFIQKERINQITQDYLRLSFNKENLLENISDTYIKFERMKYRLSILVLDIFRFDFSVINSSEYSVEIEILVPNVKDMNHFEECFKKFEILIKPIINKFEKLTFDNINPPQPHSLTYSNLFMISSNNYTVTEKADGIRTFLKIKNKKVSLINPKTKKSIRDIGEFNIRDTLIDGEYVNNRFFAFDIMFFDGVDIRDKNLLERLNILTNNLSKIKIALYMKVKKFYKTDLFSNGKKLLDAYYPYKIDGLIFTPIYQTYNGKDLPIFKWKIRETIDVRVKYMRKDNFTYFIYGRRYGRIKEWSMEYFERDFVKSQDFRTKKMHTMFHNQEYEMLSNKKIHFGKYKHFNSKLFNTPYLGKPGKPNEDPQTGKKLNKNIDFIMDKYDIIEYEFRNGEWYPLRKRTFDKDEANAIKTIDGVLKVIEDNVTIEKMIEFEKKYSIKNFQITSMYNKVAQDKTFIRNNWRKFHNYVKRKTIINASNSCNGGSYLDLACGKGGDLGKYMHMGYKNILAIDSSDIELYGKNGYIQRLHNFGFVDKGLYYQHKDVKITVICGDISISIRNGDFMKNKSDMDKLQDFFSRSSHFDTISIMFAIHYMFNSEYKVQTFFDNIVDLLKPNGKFIGTYLNLNTNDDYIFKHHTIPFYKIKNMDNEIEIQNAVWGWENKIKEPKINKSLLDEWIEEFDFITVSNDSFETLYRLFTMNEGIRLTEDEKKLGFLNNYFMFVRAPNVIEKQIKL